MRLKKFLRSTDALVVYSEGAAYRPFLAPIVEEYASRGNAVAYVTSEKRDCKSPWVSPNVRNFYVGVGVKRIWFFQTLSAKAMLMTMPDLETFHIKRSVHPVHYVYTQHSLNSLHMVYREGAFDAYDTIFAAGPHHSLEVRELEKLRGTKVKNIVEQGYVLIDEQRQVAAQAGTTNSPEDSSNSKPITVLVAPSWGPEGLLENYAEETLLPLLEAGMQVILRPHIRTLQLAGETINPIIDSLEGNPLFSLDLGSSAIDSFTKSDVMISAWSGVSFEYALAFRKPVISIDVPRKNFNPQYSQIKSEPIEISMRDLLGLVVQPTDLHRLPKHVGDLLSQGEKWKQRLEGVGNQILFNQGSAAKSAAEALELIVESTERD